MRIGIMLRTLHERGGVGVYAKYITEELLARDRENEYVLYYLGRSHVGTFAHYSNVEERPLKTTNKAVWDQISVPLACRRDRIDVLFHPKFTVPLLAPCPSVMVLHGAGWFIPEHQKYWGAMDVRYLRLVMPLYCRRAKAILSVSNVTTDIFTRLFRLPEGKVKTVYLAPGKHFSRVEDTAILDSVRKRYGLPEQFVFTLSKYPGGDRKNIDGIFAAYEAVHGTTDHKLVVGGKNCDKFRDDYHLPSDGFGKDVLFPGYIAQEDLPAVYSLASVFLYPSNMEAFPIPVTEAMACGTPLITSTGNGLKEIAGEGAVLVDPREHSAIAAALDHVLQNEDVRTSLGQKGLERSKMYSWEKCASETLDVLENCR